MLGLEDIIGMCNKQLALADAADSTFTQLAEAQNGEGETEEREASLRQNKPTVTGSETGGVITGEAKYQQFLKTADNAFAEKKYDLAKENYEKALMHKRTSDLLGKIELCNKKLKSAEYDDLIAKADRAFARGDYEVAQRFYKRASDYAGDTYANDRVEECAEKIAEGILRYEGNYEYGSKRI